MRRNAIMIAGLLLALGAASRTAPATTPPRTFEIALVQMFDNTGPRSEYVFAAGVYGFRDVVGLKSIVPYLGRGATLKWNPGCEHRPDEPRLFASDSQLESFRKFCAAHGVKFVNILAG